MNARVFRVGFVLFDMKIELIGSSSYWQTIVLYYIWGARIIWFPVLLPISLSTYFFLVADMGSHYISESGIYVTSLAATIFIGGLTAIGVLLITMLIALVVMLQSCQTETSGTFGLSKASDYYSYCKSFALHAEINGLGVKDFPSVCKDFPIHYIKEGQYAKDFKFTLLLAENYLSTVTPLDDGLDAVLLDVDGFSSSNTQYRYLHPHHPSFLWTCLLLVYIYQKKKCLLLV